MWQCMSSSFTHVKYIELMNSLHGPTRTLYHGLDNMCNKGLCTGCYSWKESRPWIQSVMIVGIPASLSKANGKIIKICLKYTWWLCCLWGQGIHWLTSFYAVLIDGVFEEWLGLKIDEKIQEICRVIATSYYFGEDKTRKKIHQN